MSDTEDELSSCSDDNNRSFAAQMIQRNREQQQAISKTWGYNLYQKIVEFPSDILSSLRNNLLPPISTLRSAEAFREEPARQAQRIDARISAIVHEIDALKKEKAALSEESKPYRTTLRGCDAVLSPVRRLPFDIICEIARHTLPPHPSPRSNQSPLNIAQTSSMWRAAAQSLPHLWSTLYVIFNVEDSWRKARRQIAGFFIHAKKQPLSLFLFFDGTHDKNPNPRATNVLARFLKYIGPTMHQVERLGIGAYDLAYIWNHLDLAESSWDLESLKYLHTLSQHVSTADEGAVILPAAAFHNTPSLTQMSARGGFFSCAAVTSRLLIDPSSLRELRVTEDLSVVGWANLLHLCPRLEVGQFRIQTWDDSEPQAIAGTHEAIRDLSLEIMYENTTVTAILSQFQMPALSVLRISSEDEEVRIGPPSTFTSFANVRQLSISITGHPLSDIQGILSETTNLEDLVLTSCPLSTSTLFETMAFHSSVPNATTPTTAHSNILTRLSAIRVETQSQLWRRDNFKLMAETSLYVDAFARMLDSRRPSQVLPGCQALRKAVFHLHRVEDSSSSKSVLDDLLEKTTLSRSEGLVLHCLDLSSKELLDWEDDLTLHPFHTWHAPEIY